MPQACAGLRIFNDSSCTRVLLPDIPADESAITQSSLSYRQQKSGSLKIATALHESVDLLEQINKRKGGSHFPGENMHSPGMPK